MIETIAIAFGIICGVIYGEIQRRHDIRREALLEAWRDLALVAVAELKKRDEEAGKMANKEEEQMTLTTEQAIKELNDMLAFEIDEFGEVPESEEAVYMAINALKECKTGKWEKDENGTDHCSCCDYIPAYDTAIDDIYYSPYCPNCGAKMEADE